MIFSERTFTEKDKDKDEDKDKDKDKAKTKNEKDPTCAIFSEKQRMQRYQI